MTRGKIIIALILLTLTIAYRKVTYRVDLHTHQDEVQNIVFIHAAVGIFQKKIRRNETWGYGREIMEEMLHNIAGTSLAQNIGTVYVTLLGNQPDRVSARATLATFNATGKPLGGKIKVLATATNLYLAEFPTLFGIQEMVGSLKPDNNILYLHTKGMRNNGKGRHDWRRYMSYFLVNRSEVCLEALRNNYQTCGVQLTPQHYQGNFWWVSMNSFFIIFSYNLLALTAICLHFCIVFSIRKG